jgi:hypothetical protein
MPTGFRIPVMVSLVRGWKRLGGAALAIGKAIAR